ncbi:MAG: molybdenum cofactor biosynthesis protein MoaE [Anaerolineae bacterium]|nr:molybdenum cofactor biosynthesis protein MoaE [Anaerolineae bacterium]
MMKLSILLFATLKEIVGQGEYVIELPNSATVADAKSELARRFPAVQPHLGTAITAINREFAFPEDSLKDGDELALFPPVSGGAPYAEIVWLPDAPFSTDDLIRRITTPDTGAVCVFSGMVRGETVAKEGIIHTASLNYEAYEEMALEKMRQVITEIRKQWPLVQGVAVAQRVGHLQVGENTILIAIASGHRDQGCFEAARYGIDRLKQIVPVWKQEIRTEGDVWVEGGYQPTEQDRLP